MLRILLWVSRHFYRCKAFPQYSNVQLQLQWLSTRAYSRLITFLQWESRTNDDGDNKTADIFIWCVCVSLMPNVKYPVRYYYTRIQVIKKLRKH